MKLDGKVAIVTGSARSIGRASAIQFAKEGAKVTVADIRANLAAETVRMIESAGGQASFVLTDVSKEADVKNMVEGRSHVGAALTSCSTTPGWLSSSWWRTCRKPNGTRFRVNLKSVFFGVKYGVPHMRNQGGGVILDRVHQWIGGPTQTPSYVASKGAVVLLTKALALDYGHANIRINACAQASPTGGISRAHRCQLRPRGAY